MTIKIIELENIGFNKSEEEAFAKLFLDIVDKMMPTLARESWYSLADFDLDEGLDTKGMLLMIVRKTIHHNDQWRGFLQGDKKRLKFLIAEDS